MDIMEYIYVMKYTYNGILLSHTKKHGNPTICDSMDGPCRCYAKWNKSERKTNAVWSHLYMRPKQTDKHQTWKKRSDLCLSNIGGDEGRIWRKVIKSYKLSVIRDVGAREVIKTW